jgi:DNA modification methylase
VDYFGGSGTTLIASKETGRNCIIFEKNETYCKIIETRIKNEKNLDTINLETVYDNLFESQIPSKV